MEAGWTREVRKGRLEFSKIGKGNREKLKGIFSSLHTSDDKLFLRPIFLSRNLQFQQQYTYVSEHVHCLSYGDVKGQVKASKGTAPLVSSGKAIV